MLVAESTKPADGRPLSDTESQGRSRTRDRKMIPRRSRKLDDLILDWSDRERRAEQEAKDIAENGLSGILSPRENKKSADDGNHKPNGMSSLEGQATNSDGDGGWAEQPRARYQHQYDQRPLYNDNPRPKRSRSAGPHTQHSGYRRDDYIQVAETRSSQQYRYESHSEREIRRGEQDRGERSYSGVKSQQYDYSYQYETHPRDVQIMTSKSGEQYWSPTIEGNTCTSPTTRNGQYLPGPPKPPRRQQSLNRIHIPSGPDYDEEPKSPNDLEFTSTSPESGSPKHWQTSPLLGPERGFAIVGSPTAKVPSQDHGYPSQPSASRTTGNQNQRGYAQSSTYPRSAGATPTRQHLQQDYHSRQDRARSPVSHRSPPSAPPRQSSIMRQTSMPVSRGPPQNLPRKQEVQRTASLGRKPDRYESWDNVATESHVTESHTSQRHSAKATHGPVSQSGRNHSKSRSASDRQNSRSTERPVKAERGQSKHSPEKTRHRKISSPEQGTFMGSMEIERRSSVPTVSKEQFIVRDMQKAVYASPQYVTLPRTPTSPTHTVKKGGLGALLVSDKDFDVVNADTVPWLSQKNNDNYSKPEYISDSGISSLRDGSVGPQADPYVTSKQTVPTSSWNYDYPIKPVSSFNEDTAQYRLYGDGPIDYPSHVNARETSQQPTSLYKQQSSEDHPSRRNISSAPYSSSSLDRNWKEQPRQHKPRRELLHSSSQESSDPEWKSSYYPPIQQSTRNGAWHNESPRKATFESSTPKRGQYQADEMQPQVEYSKPSHYDFPKKYYPPDENSPRPVSNYDVRISSPLANGQRIKASPNRYTAAMVEADRMSTEPAVDGGEAYWGMESRKPVLNFAQQPRLPEKIQSHHSAADSSVGRRNEAPNYYGRGSGEGLPTKTTVDATEGQIKKTEVSTNQTAPLGERQSRYDRLKYRAGSQQQHSQRFGEVSDSHQRSKSLTRLDKHDKVPQSSELPKKELKSKSTDDLEELRKKAVSRGAALFIKMRQQASMEEEDYDLDSVEPAAIDSYVGTPKLFQPQITKTGEPILNFDQPKSPDSDPKAALYIDLPTKYPEEPIVQAQVQKSEAMAPQAKTSGPPPDAAPLTTKRHGNQEVPVEWLKKQESLKSTSSAEKGPASPTKLKSPDSEPMSTVRRGNQEVPAEWPTKQERHKHTPVIEKQPASPTKVKIHESEPKIPASYHSHRVVPVGTKKDNLQNIPIADKVPASPTKLKSSDSEPAATVRRGKQDVPMEWVEVLERLRGKPKSQSSESSGYPSPPGRQGKSHRVSADFEDALSELEHMYSVLDEEADDLMLRKNYKPFEQRIAELPPALQKRLRDLKEYATAQRNKRRARRERATPDITLKTQAPPTQTSAAADTRKKQEFPPYRTSGSAVKITKPSALDLPAKTSDPRQRAHHQSPRKEQSSSDEELPTQQRSASQLYRKPRSSDNLGFSSDSSPDQTRRLRRAPISDFGKSYKSDASTTKPNSRFEAITGIVLPEYKPSVKKDSSKSHMPLKDSLNNNQVQEVITKSSAADVKTSHNIFEKLNVGSRLSIDSVSTIDSLQLSQPFDEMSSEYHKIFSEHKMDLASDDDVSPSQKSSSMESLVLTVASSGNGLLKRKTKPKGTKQGRENLDAEGKRRSGELKSASRGPVPLATFDEEPDLDIPDPALYAPVTQTRLRHSSQESYSERKSEDILSDPSIKLKTSSKAHPSKTVRPVAKLREKYSSTTPAKTETSADKIRKFIEKRDSFHSSDSEERGQSPIQASGMSGRSRLTRNGTAHNMSSPRTSSGYGAHTTDASKVGRNNVARRGGVEGGLGGMERSKGKEGSRVADSVPSRYTKPPRHDKEKVDSIRDEYLSGKAANGEITRVPRYARGRAATGVGDAGVDSTVSAAPSDTLSRVHSSSDSSEDPESRRARIAKYKEQRRKELAEKYGLKDGGSTAASSDSDPPLSRYRRDRMSREEDTASSSYTSRMQQISVHDSVMERGDSRRKHSHDSSLPSSPRSPKSPNELAARRSTSTEQQYQPPTREALQDTGVRSRQRSDSVSSTSSETRTRKDSTISAETQQLVDTLEASRAARRERMRRTVSDVSMDATEKIIAKHRARKGSIDTSDGDVFISPNKKTDEATVRPTYLPTTEGAPTARISDSDSYGSSSTTSGERLRSRSEPIDPATLTVQHGQRRAVPEEYKPPSDRGVSTKQSRSRSRRQNVSITAAQIKEASAIGQKMVERKLSLTGSPQPSTSPTNSDSSDTVRTEPTSATPAVSSQDVTSHKEDTQVPLSVPENDKLGSQVDPSSSKESPKSEESPGLDSTVTSKTETAIPVKVVSRKKVDSNSTASEPKEAVPKKVAQVKEKRIGSPSASRTSSPRVTSPEKLQSSRRVPTERKSPEKKVPSRSPEKTPKVSSPEKTSKQTPSMSSTDSDVGSPSKVRLKRPEIPQVLSESRRRRNSNESNSSLNDGTLSPTHRAAKAKGSDTDSRASPTLSPVHRANRKVPEPSSRIQELAKPRRVETKKEPMQNGEAKKGERRTPTSPEKKLKAKADVAIHSKSENGVLVDRGKGRESPKLKEPEVTVSAKVTQKPPSSKDKVTPQVKAKTVSKQTAKNEIPRQAKPLKEAPKTATKTQAKSSKVEAKDNAVKRQSSFKSRKSPETPEPTDVKKVALATKDSELIAVMRARALSLQDDDDEEEEGSRRENETEIQEEKPEDVIKVPVAERLQVFRSAEKLDSKPPMPPVSPGSPRSPRRSSQIRVEPQEMDFQRAITPTEKSSEAEAETEPDELAQLSVSAKKHMFTQISKQKEEEAAKAKPRRRFHRVRHSERSQTQPVTPEEFSSASTLANLSSSESKAGEAKEPEVDEDDASRLSLAEKMKLFHQKAVVQDKPPPRVEAPKRKRRVDSRFRTQPVTIDEVKKAADFSPLARSFTRPPDEVAGLPLAEQIALVYGSSERLERKPSIERLDRKTSLQDEKPPRKVSETGSPEKKGILKESSFEKTDSGSDEPPKGILKSDSDGSQDQPQKGRSILKSEEVNVVHSDPEVRSILKERADSKSGDPEETRSILRRDSGREKDDTDSDRTEKSILKKDSTSEKPPLSGIIRKTSDTAGATSPQRDSGERDVRPKESPRKAALKKDDSQDADVDSGTDDPVKRKSGLAMEQLRLRKEKASLRAEGYSSSDSETEVRARARSTPISPAVEIRTVKKKQVPELDLTKKRHKSPSPADRGLRSPRRMKSPDPGRFQTQPVTPEEMAKVRQLTEPVKTSGSIAERLMALKKSGEEDWQKRINKYNDSPRTKLKDFLTVPGSDKGSCRSDEDLELASCSISKRLELIQTSQSSWKQRVEEKDVTQFTVTGKMTKAGKDVVETSPQLKRAGSGRVKRGGSFRGRVTLSDKKDGDQKADDNKDAEEKEKDASEKSEDKSESVSSKTTSLSGKEPESQGSSTTATTTTESDSESGFRIVKRKIAVMKPDDETFAEFFSSSSTIITEAAMIPKDRKASLDDVTVSDFDALSEMHLPKLTALSKNRMSLRPKRRAHGTKNPIRALKTRSNVITEYEEVKKEVVETKLPDRTEVMRSRRVELSSRSNLHQSARKGLASKEDIAKGLQKLQKVKDVREMEGKLSQLLPYKELMLLHIKGRRFVQVRLVEPSAKMLNTGDCFVLVTPKECFQWIGEYSNVIERSKASEISGLIQTTRDLGCKAPSVVTVEESKGQALGSTRDWKRFMAALGGTDEVKDIARADEDEMHEIYITETNMVYKVEGESLVPYDDYWGAPPKFAMLKSNEILVFDFGSELYIWQGKQTSAKERQTAAKLAQIVWERGYDYREFDINPLWPGHPKKPTHSSDRPDWALFGKTTEHMETVLFQNKFIDWPSESRIKTKPPEEEQKNEPAPELVPYDASKMIQPSKEKTDLILENTNLGRGRGTNAAKTESERAHFEKIDQRGNEITTLSVVVWHVLEYEHSILPKESFGQFHEGDTYVVRWQYRVESTGMRDLKGNLSKRGLGHGRERCAYFFWQGQGSTINEKGASALMTVELDDERGPQRQVIQGKEPAAFLQLFDGRMVVHIGKREEEETNTSGANRLYCIRSEHAEEGLLVETECKSHQLRSRTSFVLLHLNESLNKATICVWHGEKSSKATRAVAVHAANMLKENTPLETGMKSGCRVTIEEMVEGKETNIFKKVLGVDRSAYDSAIGDPLVYDYTPRLFHLTSKSGVFVANEILNQSRSEEAFTPYPFQQTELYGASQPAQFLFDNHYEVYLWQGWWPEDQDKKTGSAKMRWDIDRRCGMETVMAYCKAKRIKNPPKAYLVHAGLEPLTFTNLFPWWRVDSSVAEINIKDGKRGDRAILVSEVLEKLTKAQYTFAELQERPLPDGVDPLKLETYLSVEEFKEKLKMGKEEFYKMPSWKQLKIKKEVGLF